MIVMEETRMMNAINVVLMKVFVDNVKVVWKNRAMSE
jgi:hypothetical protein